jgi:tRNA pseudouridine55 synthase
MGRKRKGNPVHGWLVLDKPLGLSSNQALGRARFLLQAAKAGHAGTLDPLATGILPLAFGEATKLVSYAMDGAKTYQFTLCWGESRTTDDGEGEVVERSDVRPDAAAINAVLPQFTGAIMQKPPPFSAIKVNGKRAYELARAGDAPDLPAREIQIDRLTLLEAGADTARFEVDCGKGTYIRSLARDMAEALGSRGYVSELRRTRVGPFTEADAFSLDKLEELSHSAPPEKTLLPLETPLDDIPEVAVMDSEADRLRSGQAIRIPQKLAGEVFITASDGPVGLGWLEEGVLRPKRVFNL